MVVKKSFILLVTTATPPFFAFVSIIFEQDCRFYFSTFLKNGTFLKKVGRPHPPIDGSTYKRAITFTFTITMNGDFLPIQAIYEGTTTRVNFPKSFCSSKKV